MGQYKLLFKRFRSLEQTWKAMETPGMSPFLHYDYMRFIYYQTRLQCLAKPKIICISENDDILVIIPLCFRGKAIYMLGDIYGCGKADIIVKPGLRTYQLKQCLDLFFNSVAQREIHLNRIQADSYLLQSISRECNIDKTDNTHVNISVYQPFEQYFASLSANMRQNLRTAYNRMDRDSVVFHLSCYQGEKAIPFSTRWKMIKLYYNRLRIKYKKGCFSPETKGGTLIQCMKYLHFLTVKRITTFLKHDSFSLYTLANELHFVLWDGKRVMAFMSGLTTEDQETFSVPRLSINDKYSFYSPGCVLIAETLSYLAKNTKVQNLDLSRGDEPYKFKMGGTAYRTYNLSIR